MWVIERRGGGEIVKSPGKKIRGVSILGTGTWDDVAVYLWSYSILFNFKTAFTMDGIIKTG